MNDDRDNPMNHPPEQPTGSDGAPKFGRLLLILGGAVLVIVAVTFISEALYS
ncbi:hypothetical protein [Noviherbaspirillum sp.]|uniref:hypothetical protein n=1 Tax=Noviherbaspirillum sp. TaxID=1926288 RepID=UPI002D610283|nr:hypothetical protein [Noviherbaspirillum sp.]HZW21253.1 hypothetical protein [Noviherbaspirillum sp.]